MLRLFALTAMLAFTFPAVAQDRPDGMAASKMLTMAVHDAAGVEVGQVVDLVLDHQSGRFTAVVAELEGLQIDRPSQVMIPWDAMTLRGGAVHVPVGAGGLEAYAPLQPDPVIGGDQSPQPGLGWKLTNLIDDYAVLRGGIGYGQVADVVFAPDSGALLSVVVAPSRRFNDTVQEAYAFEPSAWTPQAGIYALPRGVD